jgi:lantibiotic biosynthesis dehydratase-like protein
VELAARIHATSVQALDDGEYALTVAPARAGGTLTSRFTATMTGSGLEQVYRALPTGCAGALAVQLSFGPAYPHAENVCRVPAYLPHVLSLGEHRTPAPDSPDLDIAKARIAEPDLTVIALDDVAVTATHDALHLVSLSHHRVIEPQVFHALALDKQPPPLVRFLAHLPRAYRATSTVLDWGPAGERLPYLPRVRYGRSILARARWRIPAAELPRHDVDDDVWGKELDGWLRRWSCPTTIELRDDDRSLRLDLAVPLHAAILRTHLARHDEATLVEAIPDTEHGWFDGHAHEIAVPLVRTGPPAPDPLTGRRLPVVRNTRHGQWPGEPGVRWLSLRLHTHPERHYEIISQRVVPELLAQTVRAAAGYREVAGLLRPAGPARGTSGRGCRVAFNLPAIRGRFDDVDITAPGAPALPLRPWRPRWRSCRLHRWPPQAGPAAQATTIRGSAGGAFNPTRCTKPSTTILPGVPWTQQRLTPQRIWPLTTGWGDRRVLGAGQGDPVCRAGTAGPRGQQRMIGYASGKVAT